MESSKSDFDTPVIHGYHSHVYFGPDTVEQARALCEGAAQRFALKLGRMHQQPVGPHPDWSCQLAYRPEVFAQLMPWLAMHRGGLVVFTHPISDNDRVDHRDRAIWMGAVRPLKLEVLPETPGHYDF